MCFSPNILLEPVAREQIPQNPGTSSCRKHCTLTLNVKAADFASRFFYPWMLRGCEVDVLQCSVTRPRIAGKTAQPVCRACYCVGTAQMRRPIHLGKRNEPEGM
jgi:hypothetical protein